MIILISGSINSGKSTIAKLLSKKIKNPALLEIDDLSRAIEYLPIDQRIDINLENAALLINNFVKKGFNPIIPYPLSLKNFKYLKNKLAKNKEKIYFFVLNPNLNDALKNRGDRKLTNLEKQRIKHHYAIKINNPGQGIIIDNGQEKPTATVQKILKIINHLA